MRVKPLWFVRDDGGQVVTLLFVILLPLFLIVGGFVLDYGRAYLLKHQLQSACDAAALAGVSMAEARFVGSGVKVMVNPTLAQYEAAAAFERNVSASDFPSELVHVQSYSGQTLDADGDGYLDSYRMEATATIRTTLLGMLEGTPGRLTVRAMAQAQAKQLH